MNAREQRLLMAFGLLILLGAGFIGYKLMASWMKKIQDSEQQLSLRKVEADELLLQEDFWTQRSQWISEKQPKYISQKDSDNALADLIVETAKQQGITLGARSQEQPEPHGTSTAIAVTITEAKGPYDKMLRWLHSLQRPEAFLAITGLTLKPDAEDTKLLYATDMRVQKWYRIAADTEPTAADTPQQEAPAAP
jgi:type II secretory pathway component PulM